MKIFIAIILTLALPVLGFSGEKNSRQFRIEAKIYIGSQLISSPKIATIDGSKAEISQISEDTSSALRLEVTPSSSANSISDDTVLLQVALERKLGKQLLKSSSSVETLLDKDIVLISESESSQGPLKIVLRVVAL